MSTEAELAEARSRIHKAVPAEDPENRCAVCGQFIRAVPGGQGTTYVHADSGAVAAPNPPAPGPRPLHRIADDITRHWPEPWFGARPYIWGLRHVATKGDMFGEDSGDTLIRYFLSNARYWRGPHATRIKAELRAILADDLKREVRP